MNEHQKIKLWKSIVEACDGVTVTAQLGEKCTLHIEGNFIRLAKVYGEIMLLLEMNNED